MPSIEIINDTNVPLHIALRHISPIHFVNNVPPQGGKAVFPHVGRVWFTVEARVARQPARAAGAEQTTDQDERRQIEAAGGGEAGQGTGSEVAAAPSSTPDTGNKKGAVSSSKDKAKALTASVKAKYTELRNSTGLDPDNTSNEYTTFQSVAAPVAVSVAALSLGAGAIYIGLTAAATGGIGAALTATSAEVSAAAASGAPTAHRLYKFAKQGQKVAQIGHVLGIGGGAIGGTWLGHRKEKEVREQEQEQKQKAVAGGSGSGSGANSSSAAEPPSDLFDKLTDEDNVRRVKAVSRVLKRLVTKPVVRSHGWYMGQERTIRIRGGPQAAEVEQWLVIETDTVEPFEVVGERVEGDKEGGTEEEEAAAREEDAGMTSGTSSPGVTAIGDSARIVEIHDPLKDIKKEEEKELTKSN